jgi:hypothetical protein
MRRVGMDVMDAFSAALRGGKRVFFCPLQQKAEL